MSRSFLSLNYMRLAAALLLGVVLVSCGKKEEATPYLETSAPASIPKGAPSSPTTQESPIHQDVDSASGVASTNVAKTHIAVSHALVIETPPEQLQKAYEETLRLCEAQGCRILSAEMKNTTVWDSPSASIDVQIDPVHLAALMNGTERAGKVIEHSLSRDDKTDEMIDIEARIVNLEGARDKLRTMLISHSASVKDLLEIQKALTETQSELDSLTGRWKYLTRLTEWVTVRMRFQSRANLSDRNSFQAVGQAWAEVGDDFMSSLAAMIRMGAAVLPWLLVLIPGGAVVRSIWKKRRDKQGR